MDNTQNLSLKKPSGNDYVNIQDINDNMDIIDKAVGKNTKSIEDIADVQIPELKKSVSDGKELIAAAITQKEVPTAATDSFAKMAENIIQISTGKGDAQPEDVLSGKTFTNDTGFQVGTMKDCGPNQMGVDFGEGGTGENEFYTINQLPEGYYHATTNPEWQPEARIKKTIVRQKLGVAANKIIKGQTIAGIAGTVEVHSVVSFSIASVSGVNMTLRWQNPAKGPYGGVIIRYKTGGYPTSITDGTPIYKGTGTNKELNGISTCTVKMGSSNTRYYFRIWMYCETSLGTWYSDYKEANGWTDNVKGTQIFTSSGTFTVPDGVRSVQVFMVGGGGAGGADQSSNSGGGGGGYTKTLTATVYPGQKVVIKVGAGGVTGDGGASSWGDTTVNGGQAGWANHGGNGGSGGGASGNDDIPPDNVGADGGEDGSDGHNTSYTAGTPGTGQRTTTRRFGESANVLYAGGGGGATRSRRTAQPGGAGGAGGGGYGDGATNTPGKGGTANTGGGGGGRNYSGEGNDPYTKYPGGSGLVYVRWGY
ncbi:MAG TPA: hypothetical protein H9740_09705 [Candidatus Hungatella pullicola]|nr:hypothetical protein [Candidatus Hungatella pullicola]